MGKSIMDVCANRGAERCSEIGELRTPMDDAIPKGIPIHENHVHSTPAKQKE